MNQDAPVTRLEFDRAIRELHAEIRAARSAPPAVAGAGPALSPDDFVRRDEFRLFKWFTGIAFAAVLGGFGVLYQAITDVQRGLVEVHRSIVVLQQGLVEVHQNLAEVHQNLAEVHQSLAEVHQSLGDIRERLVRVETVLEVGDRASPGDPSPGAD